MATLVGGGACGRTEALAGAGLGLAMSGDALLAGVESDAGDAGAAVESEAGEP